MRVIFSIIHAIGNVKNCSYIQDFCIYSVISIYDVIKQQHLKTEITPFKSSIHEISCAVFEVSGRSVSKIKLMLLD